MKTKTIIFFAASLLIIFSAGFSRAEIITQKNISIRLLNELLSLKNAIRDIENKIEDVKTGKSKYSKTYLLRLETASWNRLKNLRAEIKKELSPSSANVVKSTNTRKSITVVQPAGNGRIEWKAGQTEIIAWNSAGIESERVGIELYRYSDKLISTIINNKDLPPKGSFSWKIPPIFPSGDYFLRIYSTGIEAKSGKIEIVSDVEEKRIIKPHISSISPTNGTWTTTISIRGNNFSTLPENLINAVNENGGAVSILEKSPDGQNLSFSIGNYSPGKYTITVMRVDQEGASSNEAQFMLSVPKPYLSVSGLSEKLARNSTYNISGLVKNSIPNAPVLLFLKRPDDTFKYDAREIGKTDAAGNFEIVQKQTIEPYGKDGLWSAWITIGGVESDKVSYGVYGK